MESLLDENALQMCMYTYPGIGENFVNLELPYLDQMAIILYI